MKKSLLISLIASFAFISCTAPVKKSAKVIDSKVEGLEYRCAGEMHFTDKNGTLTCRFLPITFRLGQIKLGIIYKVPKDGIILPQDILDISRANLTDKNLIKLTILLQSLDADKNVSNGITITEDIRKKLNRYIEIKRVSLPELKAYLEDKLGEVVTRDKKEAIMHLQKSMRRYNIPTPKNINFDSIFY